MAVKKRWYQDPKIAVPVFLALIGLTGTIVKVVAGKDEARKEKPPPSQVATTTTPASSTPAPAPESLVSFPVVVIDDATGDHIASAKIVADEQGISTETDSQGRCTLSVRPGQGKLRVTVSHSGYKTQNVELTVFAGMDPARIRLQKS